MSDKSHNLILNNKPTKLGGFIVATICATFIFATLAFGLVDSWGLAFLSLSTAIIVIFWTIDSIKSSEFSSNFSVLLLPMLGLLCLGFIQLLPLFSPNIPSDLLPVNGVSSISLDPNTTKLFLCYLIVYIIVFAASLTFINSKKRITRVAVTIIIFGTVMAFFAIIQRLANIEGLYGIRNLNQSQAIGFGSFVNPHHFAALMEMTLSLSLGLLFSLSAKKEQMFLLIFSAILMTIAVLFTGSRGGMISLIGIGIFFVALRLFNPEKNKEASTSKNILIPVVGVLGIVSVIVGITFSLGGDTSLIRSVGLSEFTQADVSSGRLDFWKIALQIFINNPIFGSGFDSFAVAMSRYDTWNGTFRIEQAHNDYLQILAEAGLLGLGCVLVFIFLTFKKGLENIKFSEDRLCRGISVGALAGCSGIFIHSIVDFPLRTPSNMLIFLVLAALATVSISRQKSNFSL
jgi:O-antigen ligase